MMKSKSVAIIVLIALITISSALTTRGQSCSTNSDCASANCRAGYPGERAVCCPAWMSWCSYLNSCQFSSNCCASSGASCNSGSCGLCSSMYCAGANHCCPTNQYWNCLTSRCVSPVSEEGTCYAGACGDDVCSGSLTCNSASGTSGRCCNNAANRWWNCLANACTSPIARGGACSTTCGTNACSGSDVCSMDWANSGGKCCPSGQRWCAATGCSASCAACGNAPTSCTNSPESGEACDLGAGNAGTTKYCGGSSSSCGADPQAVCTNCQTYQTVSSGSPPLNNCDNFISGVSLGDRCSAFCSGKNRQTRDCYMTSTGSCQCTSVTLQTCANACCSGNCISGACPATCTP